MATEPPAAPGTSQDQPDLAEAGAAPAAGDASAPPGAPGRAVDPRTRQRLDEVFGAAPTVTSDELGIDEPVRDTRPGAAAERELLENRPPHHDRD